MKRGQRPSAEQVVLMLRQIEVQTAQGKSIAAVCKEVDVYEQSYRDECLRQEIFYLRREAQTVIALWRNTDNRVRPHSSVGYRPPAPVTFPDLAYRRPIALAIQ
ncbi:Integrase catalytic domain-containing protein [Methylorubrum aminovorans]